MYCIKCGKLLGKDDKFCMNCGSKVDNTMISPNENSINNNKLHGNMFIDIHKNKNVFIGILLSILFVLFIVMIIFMNMGIRGRFYQCFAGEFNGYYIDFKSNGMAEDSDGMKLVYKQSGNIINISEASYDEEIDSYELKNRNLYSLNNTDKVFYPKKSIKNVDEIEQKSVTDSEKNVSEWDDGETVNEQTASSKGFFDIFKGDNIK